MIPQAAADQQVVTISKCPKGLKGIKVILTSKAELPRVTCNDRKRSGFLGDDSCIENAGTKRRKLRAGTKKKVSRDVEEREEAENLEHNEVLDEMGLNILSDNSNSCDTLQAPQNSRSQVSY